MDFQLTDSLRPLPVVKPERKRATPKMRLTCKAGKAWISIPGSIRTQMGLDPKKAHRATVLASRAQIGVQPVAADAHDDTARPLSTGGRINVPEAVETMHLKDGEVFEIPVALENGILVGPMPEAVFTRVGFMVRRNRVNGKAA